MTVDLSAVIIPLFLLTAGAVVTFFVNRWLKNAMREREQEQKDAIEAQRERETKLDMLLLKFDALREALSVCVPDRCAFEKEYEARYARRLADWKTATGRNGHE